MRGIATYWKSCISCRRYCIFKNRAFRAPLENDFQKTQHPPLQTLTFAILSNTSQLICEMSKSHRRYCKNKQKSVFRIECCAFLLSKNTIRLSSIDCFSLHSHYLRCENGHKDDKPRSKKLWHRLTGQRRNRKEPAKTEFGWPRPSGRDNINRFYIT